LKNRQNLEDLEQRANKLRPLLKLWTEKAKLEIKKAERTAIINRPDITLWAGYRIRKEIAMDQGTDFISIGASIPLTLDYNNRNKSKESLFKYNAAAATAKIDSIANKIKLGIENSLAIWDRAFQQSTTYENQIIPSAKKTMDAALSSYQVGKTNFEALYQSELMVIMAEKKVVMAKVKPLLMAAKIEMLTGDKIEYDAGDKK